MGPPGTNLKQFAAELAGVTGVFCDSLSRLCC